MMDIQQHWEKIYSIKAPNEMSWFQDSPLISLNLIRQTLIKKDEAIIDIGGGDSLLVDHLLEMGYSNISILDISGKALERAKLRLGDQSETIDWITVDIRLFTPSKQYSLWHDRAAFHFLTNEGDVKNYIELSSRAIKKGGNLIIGTFSKNGPEKCSALPVIQYSSEDLELLFKANFQFVKSDIHLHKTPSGGFQEFTFVHFNRK